MIENKNIFQTLKSIILSLTLFFFPLFFLPTTQEYFTTNKFYLISAVGILLMLTSAVEILTTGKFQLRFKKIDLLKIFFLATVLLSTIISSPNKIQALLNPNFGFAALLSIAIFTVYLDRASVVVSKILSLSTFILSATTIVFFFHPFRNNQFPFELQFLKNRFFTPLGTQIDLAVFLGFMIVVEILQLVLLSKSAKKSSLTTGYYLLTTILTLSAFGLAIYSLLAGGTDEMMPFTYSWYSFAETMKNPLSAIFGFGIDNIASVFTRVKDIHYNLSNLWEIRSFDFSRTSLLHIATESGLLGLSAIILILVWAYKNVVNQQKLILLPLLYLTVIFLFFPPSLTVFFIFFLVLTMNNEQSTISNSSLTSPLIFPIGIILIILTIASAFFLSRTYLAEYYFKQSIDALAKKNGRALYDWQRKATITNPFIERFHINFSQTNLLLASSLGQKLKKSLPAGRQASKQELKNIKDAQQTAIVEANNAVILNPQKASNWENLGLISRNLADVFEDPQKQTIEAYEKAILLDPQNPIYRLNLGSIYYLQQDFAQAVRLFEQTVALKKNWTNGHYNLSWALFQKQEYKNAVIEMEIAISLLDPEKDKTDREKAQKDLEMMRNKAKPGEPPIVNEIPSSSLERLTFPAPYVSTSEPQLDFSEIASPEAE